ncbi:MAG: monofunctional biosynthetic peptidoglycan transglycosylase [Bacteroidales bacterium]|nr:monofunctional biosynthetic peptidoglycan transglycosylase [Bacteroidales bacterium]
MAKSKKPLKSGSGKKKGFFRTFFKIVGYTLLTLFILSLLMPLLYKWVNPPVTPLMLIRKVQYGYSIEYEWRDLDQISQNMVQCAVASEDNRFLGHKGFDMAAIDRAIEEREHGGRRRGASTISQQTAKNVFLWPKSSWVRKGCEAYFTFLIEHMWSKERIMEVYLNVIEMGPGIYGAEAAAQHYYHTSAKRLTLRQSALITACYPNPLKRNPTRVTSYLNRRAAQIMGMSKKVGRIKYDDATVAAARERYLKSEEKRKNRKKK